MVEGPAESTGSLNFSTNHCPPECRNRRIAVWNWRFPGMDDQSTSLPRRVYPSRGRCRIHSRLPEVVVPCAEGDIEVSPSRMSRKDPPICRSCLRTSYCAVNKVPVGRIGSVFIDGAMHMSDPPASMAIHLDVLDAMRSAHIPLVHGTITFSMSARRTSARSRVSKRS